MVLAVKSYDFCTCSLLPFSLKLNPEAIPFIPKRTARGTATTCRRGERRNGEDPVGTQQVHTGNGGETGCHRLGGLNPTRVKKFKGTDEGTKWRIHAKNKTKRMKWVARLWKRRGRTGHRAARRKARSTRERASRRSRRQEITVATYNARTMAATGKHGVGRTTDVLQQCSDAGCDVLGLQETRRSGHNTLKTGGYMVYFSGETGLDGEKKRQGGLGLAVKAGITRNTPCTPEFAGDRLLKISLDLHGRAHAATFVEGYAQRIPMTTPRKTAFGAR